jgi:hypothetical protein
MGWFEYSFVVLPADRPQKSKDGWEILKDMIIEQDAQDYLKYIDIKIAVSLGVPENVL